MRNVSANRHSSLKMLSVCLLLVYPMVVSCELIVSTTFNQNKMKMKMKMMSVVNVLSICQNKYQRN